MSIKIDKNIPIPSRVDENSMASVIKSLQPGDSVLFETNRESVNSTAWRILGKGNFACRKVGQNKTRVWRIK